MEIRKVLRGLNPCGYYHYLEMIKEILDVMIELTGEGLTMLMVTHKMGFAKSLAHRVMFMDACQIVGQNSAQAYFNNPQNERTQLVLRQIQH